MATIQVREQHMTSDDVYAEIDARYGVTELSDAAAVTVASWWQSPGTQGRAFAALASGAPVDHRAVLADAWQARPTAEAITAGHRELDMLSTWAIAKAREIDASVHTPGWVSHS